ncbi:sugar nucleotide-binding protein [Candidatus Dojkabacteria bacterium]|uniref:dTDP-4-dehydrorhamnose reductase n=1 Tax=Candidatus Dojkabacteria bacterium TaxID=2099670 RepID=A0A955L8K5_9BACT|nr:sugar nucleotide-binding protein [Candidatus Dojkabacteria bacterium]
MKYLIFGKGYIGTKFLEKLGPSAVITSTDIGNISEVETIIATEKPDIVINAAGKTGKPNIDWCEDHKKETLYSNVTGPLVLSKVCIEHQIRMVHIGSGCIYQGGSEDTYSETDKPDPNQIPSFYSKTKAWSEEMLSYFPLLQVRLRMPIDENPQPRNLLWKITHYEKIISVPNSISVIPDFVEATLKLITMEKTGIYNVVNPGHITHAEILDMYKKYIDSNFEYELFSLKELEAVTKAGRSNCVLSTKKLEDEGIVLPEIHERLPEILQDYKKNLL